MGTQMVACGRLGIAGRDSFSARQLGDTMVETIDKAKLLAWLWGVQEEAKDIADSDNAIASHVEHHNSRSIMAMQIRWLIETGEFDDNGESWDWVI